jgi:mono/diheme cytochrome c family protein
MRITIIRIIGLLTALLTLGLTGAAAAYYLLISESGSDPSFGTVPRYEMLLALAQQPANKTASQKIIVKTDPESIGRGKNLFDSNCNFCHHDNSTETIVGPGLKGILKKPRLPVSNRPATPQNVVRQLKHPFNRMPSFDFLTDREISDILAYLNTL